VSPQNVLISYAGEVKLVDFGIAKATMKARQTAVGVIKGKYYYMSPEQAWGDPIDHRSDIFSAGIVLYEMITGQMLYLEEDLHKLLDMARKADIAPPSTLRKGIPPQLERIVMHALDKDRRTRYQTAQDFATDLERFLHTYSPVFTSAKVSQIIKQVIGTPMEVPYDDVEMRDGPMSTHTLTADDLILDKEELRDSNSVIFRVDDLKPKEDKRPTGTPEGRVTRQAEIKDLQRPTASLKAQTPPGGSPKQRTPAKPRAANEETRQVSNPAPPSGTTEDSGLLEFKTPPPAAVPSWSKHDPDTTMPDGPDLEGGEHTMITGAPSGFGGFMMDVAGEEGVEATVISAGPPSVDDDEDGETVMGARPDSDDDGATVQRDFRDAAKPKGAKRGAPPPALAASIHAPAVSEIRKPRASRKTPQGGVPAANVLQAIVGAKPSEAMPVPRPPPPPRAESPEPERNEDSGANTIPQQPSPVAGMQPPVPQQYSGYGADASGMPAQGYPQQYGQQPQYPGYPPQQGYPPPQGYPQYPGYPPPQGYAQPITPGAMYQLQPHGAPPPQQMSLTGQMRLFEADEIPDKYKVSGAGGRWIKLVIAGVLAISVAAGVTFFIIKSTRDNPPEVASVRVESVPPGAEVTFDGTRLAGATPMTVDSVPVGTRHEIKVELARHKVHTETVDIPKRGGEVPVKAFLTPITGKLRVLTEPDGAEIRIDGQLKGLAPKTITDIDMSSAKTLELRLKDYQVHTQQLVWPPNGEININQKLVR
jgi:hypothetical protein